jgi:hypothetical protein
MASLRRDRPSAALICSHAWPWILPTQSLHMDRARTPYAWPTPPSITVSHSVIKYPLRNLILLNFASVRRTTCASVAAALLVPVRADPAELEH